MSEKPKAKWGWRNAGTFTPHFYAGIPSFYNSLSKKLRNKYFKMALGNRDATIDDLTKEGLSAFVKFKDDEFKKIAGILGFSEMPQKNLDALEKAIEQYLIDKDVIPLAPRQSEVKAALREINKRAKNLDETKSLIEVLKQIDDRTLDKLAMTSFPDNLDFFDHPWEKDPNIHIRVYSASEEALNELEPDKGGRRKEKAALRNFTYRLQIIYEKNTGSKATITHHPYTEQYQGIFFDFVYGCLKVINPSEVWSNSSLGQQIKKAKKVTKEKKEKNIPINHHVKSVLDGLHVGPKLVIAGHHDFVFTYRGKPISNPGGVKRSFRTACKNAKIPYGRDTENGLIMHDIRRTVKTNMLNAGVDKVHRDWILGHSLKGMDVHYLTPDDNTLRQAMDKFTRWIDDQFQNVDQSVDQKDKKEKSVDVNP